MIIRSTIDLARHLGLRSTAEGIENAEAQQWLRAAGCDQGQGFHIAAPMSADDATAWLVDRMVVEAARSAAVVAAEAPRPADCQRRG